MSLSKENDKGNPSSEFSQNLEVLREIQFFAGLPLEAHKVFAYLAVRESFVEGDFLFRQNEDDGQAFFLVSGEANLFREQMGDQPLTLYQQGEFLGGLALLGPMPRLFSLQASGPLECLIWTREKFQKALEQFPQITPRLLQSVVTGVRSWEEHYCSSYHEGCDACRDKMGVSLL